MRPIIIALLSVALIFNSCQEQITDRYNDITFARLLTDNSIDPLGIDNTYPGLSWIAETGIPENEQTAYQILVASTPFLLDKNEGDIWDSGKVNSEQSVNIKYNGPEAKALKRYFWKVRIWDKSGNPSKYSQMAKWEMGLPNAVLWQSDWISAPRLFDWVDEKAREEVNKPFS